MRKINSITQKHFLYFLLLFLFSIASVGIYSYYVAQRSILERTFNQLASVRYEKERSIERFLSDRKNEIESFAKSGIFSPLISGKSIDTCAIEIFGRDYFKRVFIINQDLNTIQIELTEKFELKQYTDSNYFDSIQILPLIEHIMAEKQFAYQDYKIKADGNIAFYAGTPIFDNNGNLYVLAFELKNSYINTIMYEQDENNGLGKSGESYIVGRELLMRTSSRFQENSIKSIKVSTIATRDALSGLSGHGIIDDYRGISVISSYSPFDLFELNWIIIAEIDTEEALQPIYDLRNSIVVLVFIVSIFTFGLVYLGSLKITNPIILLKDAALKISRGDYETKIPTNSEDEIGELIEAFNEMAEQLFLQSKQIQKDKMLRISTMIDTLESERQRFSRDLHDGLGQMMLAVKMKIEQARKAENEKKMVYIEEGLDLLKNTINEIRSISNDLRPKVLEMFGLEEGIKKLCRDSISVSDIRFEFECQELHLENLDSKKQIYIFRIIQEIINNIHKHSQASLAQISIAIKNNMLEINVSDDGIGFELAETYLGNGIINIKERVELLSGECKIDSTEKKGTVYFISIPV